MYNQGLIDSQTGASNRQSNLEKEVEQLKKKIEEIENKLKLAEKLYQKSIQSLLTKKKNQNGNH